MNNKTFGQEPLLRVGTSLDIASARLLLYKAFSLVK